MKACGVQFYGRIFNASIPFRNIALQRRYITRSIFMHLRKQMSIQHGALCTEGSKMILLQQQQSEFPVPYLTKLIFNNKLQRQICWEPMKSEDFSKLYQRLVICHDDKFCETRSWCVCGIYASTLKFCGQIDCYVHWQDLKHVLRSRIAISLF